MKHLAVALLVILVILLVPVVWTLADARPVTFGTPGTQPPTAP